MAKNLSHSEEVYCRYLHSKLKNGPLEIYRLQGAMANLPTQARLDVGVNPHQLRAFIRRNPSQFHIDENDRVSVVSQGRKDPLFQRQLKENEEDELEGKKGFVSWLTPVYGFIEVEDEVYSVYFALNSFEDGNAKNLNDVLVKDDLVYFDAVRHAVNEKTRYRATRVWKKRGPIKRTFKSTPFINKVPYWREGDPGMGKKVSSRASTTTHESSSSRDFKSNAPFVRRDGDKGYVFDDSGEGGPLRRVSDSDREEWTSSTASSSTQESISSTGSGGAVHDLNTLLNLSGLYIPNSNESAFIQYGQMRLEVSAKVVYSHGKKVHELLWEIEQGQTIHFDATNLSQPGQEGSRLMVTLAWLGDRPKVTQHPLDLKKSLSSLSLSSDSVTMSPLDSKESMTKPNKNHLKWIDAHLSQCKKKSSQEAHNDLSQSKPAATSPPPSTSPFKLSTPVLVHPEFDAKQASNEEQHSTLEAKVNQLTRTVQFLLSSKGLTDSFLPTSLKPPSSIIHQETQTDQEWARREQTTTASQTISTGKVIYADIFQGY